MSDQRDAILAFVKFDHQVFVVSLNPSDGYETWIKVLSGLAQCPVDVILMGDKSAADRTQGITIVDHQSYLDAMKIVAVAKEQNEVLRVVLYKIDQSRVQRQTHPDSVKQHVPLTRLYNIIPKQTSDEMDNSQTPIRGFRVVPPSDSVVSDGQRPEDGVLKSDAAVQHAAPQWADQMKKDLQSVIEERFQELNSSLEEKMALLGSQMKDIMVLSQTSSLYRSGLYDSGSVPSSSSVFMPSAPPLKSTASASGSIIGGSTSSLCSSMHQWVHEPAVINDGVDTEEYWRILMNKFGPEGVSKEKTVAEDADHVRAELSDDTESVVLVSQPDSSNIALDDVEVDGRTVGERSDSMELVSADQIQRADDLASDSGSVVYVDTDGEDEEDAFSNLRSWAADGALSNSQTTYSKMADSVSETLTSSFHSTVSDRPLLPVVEQETIVYKSWPTDSVPVVADDVAVDNCHDVEEVFVGALDEAPVDSVARETNDRPVPINGSAQLPVDLNAMRDVDEQNLFSPNSDIGTMLLSAASSIANGFLQSMNSLSKTLSEYEERQRRLSQRSSGSTSVPPNESARVDIEMDPMTSSMNVETSPQVQNCAEEPASVPRAVPPRSRGPRGPPPSTGPCMTWEQLEWYLNEYGVPDLIKAPWVNDRLTLQEFEAHIVAYFDRLE